MKRKSRKRKKIDGMRLLLCGLVELIVISILVVMIGWDYGVETWFYDLTRPLVKEVDMSGLYSSHAVLIPAKGGKVIGEIGSDDLIYPASLTKVMTALVAVEELDDLEQKITLREGIFPELYAGDATQAGFQPGESVRAIDLMYGVILPSGAECCIGLAEAISGSEDKFVELMNEKARKIGMEHTHFCDSTGLHNPEHYSTVKDLAVMMKYAIRNDTVREILETSRHSTGVTNVHPDGITYYSTMIKNLEDPAITGGKILGGKTGFTNEAGLCLASFAEIEGREYILVTAGAPGTTGEPLHVLDAVTVYNRVGQAALKLN